MGIVFGGSGVSPSNRGQPSKIVELQAGAVELVPPGTWNITPGPYSRVQELDPTTGIWLGVGNSGAGTYFYNSDGVNVRIANQSGCVIGALLTTAGSGYSVLTPPTWTVSGTSAAILQSIVGGAVSTTVTVTNGGSNYMYPPLVQFSEPANPGIQASGFAVMTGTFPNLSVSSITVIDQGAGYTSPPQIMLVNDPRDGTGYNATAQCVLTGSGTVTGVVVTDHGNPVTAVPTLTVSSGSAAATAIMCWAITAYTVTTTGSGYSGVVEVTGLGGFPSGTPAYTNPTTQSRLLRGRRASILAALSTSTITATGQTVYDGGIYPGLPSALVLATTPPTVAAGLTFAMGGVNDITILAAI